MNDAHSDKQFLRRIGYHVHAPRCSTCMHYVGAVHEPNSHKIVRNAQCAAHGIEVHITAVCGHYEQSDHFKKHALRLPSPPKNGVSSSNVMGIAGR